MIEKLTEMFERLVRANEMKAEAMKRIADNYGVLLDAPMQGFSAPLVGEAGPEIIQASASANTTPPATEQPEEKSSNRPTKEEMARRRNLAVDNLKHSTLTLEAVEQEIGAPHTSWNSKQCEKVIAMAQANPKPLPGNDADAEGPAHSEPAPEAKQAETTQAPAQSAPPADETHMDEPLFAFIREVATGAPLAIKSAEALIAAWKDNKAPTPEDTRAYLAACCNTGKITKDAAMEIIRTRGKKDGMTPEQITAISVQTIDPPILRNAIVMDIARHCGAGV